ncbi:MAG: hypothetical protein HC892_07660 [Saprospiraceae bacterium]|nr:hypothetical protein [Saprospiraceae bacterium]
MRNLLYLLTLTVGVSAALWWANDTFKPFSPTFTAKSMTMSQYCETEVFHLGIPSEVASAVKLTIENVDAKSMRVEIESANNDPVDDLILNNSTGPITGAPAISEIDRSVPGKLSRILTWTDAAPREVQLNVLWSKVSFAGNWQLIPGQNNATVLFEATCDDDDDNDNPTEPIISEYCGTEVRHLGLEAEVASAILLTITNVDEFSMRVEIESANNDPVDDLILNNSFGPITGLPAISDIDRSVPGKLSRTLTWANSIVTDVELNVLWSKQSNPGNWQLVPVPAPGNISVPFAAVCDGTIITAPNIIAFPINFECEFTEYAFLEFGGAPTEVIDNPDASGINTSAKVAAMTKANGAETFAGAILTADSPIDFSISKVFKMKVWSPKSGSIVKLKLENLTNGGISDEIDATTTTTNTWEELTFDFSAKDVSSKSLQKVIVFFDFGNRGDGSVYYFDDLIQEGNNAVIPCEDPNGGGGGGTAGPNTIVFPVDFECEFIENYITLDFEGTFTEIINNPDPFGINASAKVAKTTKGNGSAVFAGTIVTFENPIDFSISSVFKVKVWSPKAQSTVRLKLENATNGGISNELDAITTVANSWQELTFDFSGTDANTKSLQKIIIFFDFGNTGDGSVYYWDDVAQEGNTGSTNCQEPPTPTAPTVAATVPPVCETAVAIFSDAYNQLEGTDFFPNWGQNPPVVVSIEDIAGGKVLKYANFSYQGIQLASAIDVSELKFFAY